MATYGPGRAARDGAALQRLGTSLFGTLAKTMEVAMAAPLVIAARTSRMQDGAADPARADHAENLLMVTEKVEAAMLTGAPVLKSMITWQRETARFWQGAAADHLRTAQRLSAARSPVEAGTVLTEAWQGLAIRAQDAALRAARGQAALARGVVAPYHSRVNGNARRLDRRGG